MINHTSGVGAAKLQFSLTPVVRKGNSATYLVFVLFYGFLSSTHSCTIYLEGRCLDFQEHPVISSQKKILQKFGNCVRDKKSEITPKCKINVRTNADELGKVQNCCENQKNWWTHYEI